MTCARCRADVPEVAHFCPRCGLDRRGDDPGRRRSYAARPDEPVASFALVSTIMPRGTGRRPQTYRVCLIIALTAALIAAIFGWLPIAVLVAAFAVPIVYIVYLYDVNVWEDEPLPVTALAFLLTAGLAAAFTAWWTGLGSLTAATGGLRSDGAAGVGSGPALVPALVVVLLVPVVAVAITQLGPVLLASRPAFDDLMDGLTFGVVAGVGYATADTLVKHGALLTGGAAGVGDPAVWASLVLLEGFVKPLVLGTAAGLAAAEFSGLGRGYDGFTPRYARACAEAVLAVIAYQAGSYGFGLLGQATLALVATLLWSVGLLAVLIIRLRTVLHTGLLEAALESSARDAGASTDDLRFCASCEQPLLPHAGFCVACGAAARVAPKSGRARISAAAGHATQTPVGSRRSASDPGRVADEQEDRR